MKKTILGLALLVLMSGATQTYAGVAATPAASGNPSAMATPQQSRMKGCAAQYYAKNIAKSQYHAFISQCLKSHPASAAASAKAVPAAPAAAGETP